MLRAPPDRLTATRRRLDWRSTLRTAGSGDEGEHLRHDRGSLRIRRWPSPVVVTSRASGQRVEQRDRVAVRRLAGPCGRAPPGWGRRPRARPGPGRRTPDRYADELQRVPVERPPGARTEPERGLEEVEQRLRLDHRRDQHQSLGRQPPVPQRQVRRDACPSSARSRRAPARTWRTTASSAWPSSTPCVRFGPCRPGVRVAVGGRVEEHDPVAGRDQRLDERRELGAAAAPAVDEVDDGAGPPEVAANPRAVGGHLERPRHRRQRGRRGSGRHGEPQVAGYPAGQPGSEQLGRRGRKLVSLLSWIRTIVLF